MSLKIISSQCKREIARIVRDIRKVRSQISNEEEKARLARTSMSEKRASAERSSKASTRDRYLRQAEEECRRVLVAGKRIGTLKDELSGLLARQGSKELNRRTAERLVKANEERIADTVRRKEAADRDRRDRLMAARQHEVKSGEM